MNKNVEVIENVYSEILKKDTFVFSDLFKDFNCSVVDNFIFSDVSLEIISDTSSSPIRNIISFSGKLKMDGSLTLFKDFVNSDEELLIVGNIVTTSKSLKEKIEPVSFSLKTVGAFYKDLFESVTLSKTIFQIDIFKNDEKWHMTSKLTGELDVLGLTHSQSDNIIFDITKKDNKLNLNAEMKSIQGAFAIATLSLKNIKINAILSEEKVLNLEAQLFAGDFSLDFIGKITPKATGMIANIQKFSISQLDTIFEELFHSRLILPLFDISFSNTSISLATSNCTIDGKELKGELSLSSELNAHGHNIMTTAKIKSKGVIFTGDLEAFEVASIDVKKSSLKFELFKKSLNKPSKFEITTCCEIEGLDVDSSISFEKYNDNWVTILYGELDTTSFKLGAVLPPVQGTFVNELGFSNIGFFYASAECITLKNNISYSLKKGIQLKGALKEIPALSNLLGEVHTGLDFSLNLGGIPDIDISIPELRLHLGHGINCDPFKIKIPIKPLPTFNLIFGMDIDIPNQKIPLHFDMILELGAIEARGSITMKNYWINPFGIDGVKIGPALALQLGIVYQQFMATGIPSEFGIAGGLEIGDTVIDMAVKITEDPSKEILSGKLKELNPKQLIDFSSDMMGIKIPEVPDFFTIKDLELYCAPSGGTIGTINYEKGFSFTGDFVIVDKKIAMHARVSDTGIKASGHIDKLELGPLKVSGKDGRDAILDLELSESKQSIFMDASLSFLGLEANTHVDISNKEICFSFEQNFFNALEYTLNGQSVGSIKEPSSLDFKLNATMDNNIIHFLENSVTDHLNTAINDTNKSIEDAQEILKEAKKAYEALFKPAEEELQKTKEKADALKEALENKVASAKKEYTKNVDKAKALLTETKDSYNSVISNAKSLVQSTKETYEGGIQTAQDGLDSAQRTYNTGIQTAQHGLDDAQRSFDSAIGYAQDQVYSARRKVNGLEDNLRDAKRSWRKASWIGTGKGKYAIKISYYEGAIVTAGQALSVVEYALKTAKNANSAVLNTAKEGLRAAKEGANYAAFNAAKEALNVAKEGANYLAFNNAKQALEAAKEGAEFTLWKNAEKALDAAKVVGNKAIDTASRALKGIADSAEYLAFKAAEWALDTVKEGSSAIAFTAAEVSLKVAKEGASTILKIAKEIAQHSGDLINIKSIKLSGSLKEVEKGNLFDAELKLALLGKDFDITLDFDVKDTLKFISSTFDKSFDEIKKIIEI